MTLREELMNNPEVIEVGKYYGRTSDEESNQ